MEEPQKCKIQSLTLMASDGLYIKVFLLWGTAAAVVALNVVIRKRKKSRANKSNKGEKQKEASCNS